MQIQKVEGIAGSTPRVEPEGKFGARAVQHTMTVYKSRLTKEATDYNSLVEVAKMSDQSGVLASEVEETCELFDLFFNMKFDQFNLEKIQKLKDKLLQTSRNKGDGEIIVRFVNHYYQIGNRTLCSAFSGIGAEYFRQGDCPK